jgi:hypothetical protein
VTRIDQLGSPYGRRESDPGDRRDAVTHRLIMSSDHTGVNDFAWLRY